MENLLIPNHGKPVEFASVQLIQNKYDTATKKRKDVVIAGMLTKANGEFNLENIPLFGQYKLHVTAIGFKELIPSLSHLVLKEVGNANNSNDSRSYAIVGMLWIKILEILKWI